MPTPDPAELIAALDERCRLACEIRNRKRNQQQRYPRASSIGDCAREIYHSIVDYRQKPAPDTYLLQRFRRGDAVEKIVTRDLLEEGWDIEAQQMPLEICERCDELDGKQIIICTGHVDGRIGWEGCKPVFDIKSLNPNVYSRINAAEDFKRMGGFWTKYPRQLLLYCYAHDEPFGLFILDDCLGHRKAIAMVLEDWLDDCEAALQIARRAAVASQKEPPEPPDFHSNPAVCTDCWAREAGVCFPPLDFQADGLHVIEDEELAADLEQLDTLREHHAEYAGIEKRVKARMKAHGAGQYLVGNFTVDVKARRFPKYAIPDDVKAQYKEDGEAIYTSWARLPGDTTDAER